MSQLLACMPQCVATERTANTKMNTPHLESTSAQHVRLVSPGRGVNSWGRGAGRLIRSAAAGIFTLLLVVLSTPDAVASCVTNKTSKSVWIEYYGTKVESPNFKRGGEWIKPGRSKCLKGRSGDWLSLEIMRDSTWRRRALSPTHA
jgi:hypothetical protein